MIDAHTLEVLEFPRVLELGARSASSPRGAEWVRALAPAPDASEAELRLDLTEELRRLALSPAGFPAIDAPDVRRTLERLEAAGVVLEAAELKDLAALAALARRIRERLKDAAGAFPLASDMAARLVPAPQLERAVADTFGPHGEIMDSASPALKQTRRHLRQQRERILGRMETYARGDSRGGERTVTLRGDRYVMAVPAAEKSAVGGIVHDRSATGATVYLEPVGLLEENNRLIELLVEEREEIRRILAALSDMARDLRSGLGTDAELLGVLDGHRALAALSIAQNAVRPRLVTGESRLFLRGFRHPLLLAGAAERRAGGGTAREVVGLDLELTPEERVLLITGPNMGGKTVAVKGVGLACVMASSGLHLPAAPGAEVPFPGSLVADIGDEQSIENDISTFASHLRRWIEATRQAGPDSLALLDEIGAGTDPAEGAALAQAVLERLAEAGGLALATTHLGALKRFASGCPGVVNGSMRFDPVTEQPLYVLDKGLPGQSRAMEMARRLGLPQPLLDRAAALVGTEERDVQALLSELETARSRVEEEKAALARESAEAREAHGKYEDRLRRLTGEYAGLKSRGLREGQRVLDRAREILRDAEETAAELARQRAAGELAAGRQRAAGELAAGRRRAAELRQRIDEAREATAETGRDDSAPGRPVSAVEIKAGGRFWAAPLQAWVTVIQPPGAGDKVRVERNGVRVELPVSALRTGSGPAAPAPAPALSRGRALAELPADEDAGPRKGGASFALPEAVRGEVDLRGLTAEEALERLEGYLDGATLGGLIEVRIIHGKGTGVLRQAVRQWLSGRPEIVSHRLGETWEGGTGVTVARLE